ncbi:MAG: type IIA DNA topoisomerase subunit B [Chitinophagales bacterium]|jgi:topoisomerase-4 subunit B|nr:type IIA DNA topoisomerase subunit B [Chitinophagales bacterium]
MTDFNNQIPINYSEEDIKSLNWLEHLRLRPGMYIGKTGDGKSMDDGIYILVKEVMDNAIDEFIMGFGREIDVTIAPDHVLIRDYGRGIPLEKIQDAVSKMNTSGKFDSKAFKKSVGMNGVGLKAVNALSKKFEVTAYRDGKSKKVTFSQGLLVDDFPIAESKEKNGTQVYFEPDDMIFRNYQFIPDYLNDLFWNYAYLNKGLKIKINNQVIESKNGLKDLIEREAKEEQRLYPVIHLKNEDIEIALTHSNAYGEHYFSFVNGQNTTQGGTHLSSFKESLVKTIRDFYKKNFEASDIRMSIVASICVRIQEPMFESQTKTKLGTVNLEGEDNLSMRSFVGDFIKTHLDNYLHQNPETNDILQRKILRNERERKDMEGIRKVAKESIKKANIHNKKLRDCRYHYTDAKYNDRDKTSLFITEGESASGSITKTRNANYQAVFSLRGKPENSFGEKKAFVYKNEELNLLQHSLNIEEGIEHLRYKNIILATDADVDGMHIRLLLLTFFLQFFPELVRNGHVKVLETPLFRVRNKKQTIYCYSEAEKQAAIKKLQGKPEITRFKGLGEISPDEFKNFIGEDIRLTPIHISETVKIEEMLRYYMGSNTKERQKFIVENLILEKDIPIENQALES